MASSFVPSIRGLRRLVAGVLAMALSCTALAGCAPVEPAAPNAPVRVASLKGPTTIGLAPLIAQQRTADSSEAAGTENAYEFEVVGTADEIVPRLSSGSVDIALIPANLAATLYQKTDGAIRAIDINTLGVLYAVTADEQLVAKEDVSVADLAGHTIYMTGKGTVPEYTLAFLLDRAGLTEGAVNIEFKSEPSEVLALLSADPKAVGILPQPFATVAVAQDPALATIMDLTEQWDRALLPDEEGALVTGVTVARTDFIEQHPEQVERFLIDHQRSVQTVTEEPAASGELLVDLGILGKAEMAAKVVPLCNVVCWYGKDLMAALPGYLDVLYQYAPGSVGGALPADEFYYSPDA